MNEHAKARCVLLQVINPHEHHEDPKLPQKNLRELEQLVETYGGEVVETAVQHRIQPHQNTYIGGGKVEWLKAVVEREKIDVVILNNVAKAGQMFRLEQILWEINPRIVVWDRVDLILQIFDLHAHSTEAKLQIELARLQHLGPRIYGLGGTVLSRQGGGIGTRGLGETNAELERRKMKKLRQDIQAKLKKLSNEHLEKIHQRHEQGSRTVALVGYTSAGKTTLFNALTGKERETHHSLFTTLDSVIGRLKLEDYTHEIVISDTIGFIDDLPPNLIDAFRSTLIESIEADVLLHVIDAGDSFLESKFEVVQEILEELQVKQTPVLLFNKADLLSIEQKTALAQKFANYEYYFVSAKTGEGLEDLKRVLEQKLTSK